MRSNQGRASAGQKWTFHGCYYFVRTDVIQGTLDMLILKTLSLEPMHGFGIARRIEQITQNVFKVNAGSR
jgi:hypothetical protein